MYSMENKSELWRGSSLKIFAILTIGFLLLSMAPTLTSIVEDSNQEKELLGSFPINPPATLPEVEAGLAKAPIEKVHANLLPYLDTGVVPDNVFSVPSGMEVLLVGEPGFDVNKARDIANVRASADLGYFTYIRATVDSPETLLALAALEGIAAVEGNHITEAKEAPAQPFAAPGGDKPDYFRIDDIVSATSATADGTGVVVGHFDTGVDYGIMDLNDSMYLDSGYPTAYDHSGHSLGDTMNTIRTNGTGYYLVPEMWSFGVLDNDYFGDGPYHSSTDFRTGYTDFPFKLGFYDWILLDLGLTGYPYRDNSATQNWNWIHVDEYASLSGNYQFGWSFFDCDGGDSMVIAALATDEHTRGVYETLYIDWRASYIATAYYNNWINVTAMPAPDDLNIDFDPTTNLDVSWYDWNTATTSWGTGDDRWTMAFDMGNGTISHNAGVWDFGTKDGFPDISIGSMAIGYDAWEVIDGSMIEGIHADGLGYAFYTDFEDHGTWTASAITGNGNAAYPSWVDETGSGGTATAMPGVADGAKLMSVKWDHAGAGSIAGAWEDHLYVAGFRMDAAGDWIWDSSNPMAHLTSNSYGPTPDVYAGFYGSYLMYDILSTPQSIDVLYPGMNMVFSAGNDGGYGTSTGYMAESNIISVGASTNEGYLADIYGPETGTGSEHYNMMYFSSKAPTGLGTPTIDVVAPGVGDAPQPIHLYDGNGTGGTYYEHDWGGTSLSCPVAAGVLAIIYEAYYNSPAGAYPEPNLAKDIMKSTADDQGFDPYTQGTGRVNAERGEDLAIEVGGGAGSAEVLVQSSSRFDNLHEYLEGIFIDSWTSNGLEYNAHFGEIYNSNDYPHTDTSLYYGIFEDGDADANETLTFGGEDPTSIAVYEYSEFGTYSRSVYYNSTYFNATEFSANQTAGTQYTFPASTSFVGWNFTASNNSITTNIWRTMIDLSDLFGADWTTAMAGDGTVGVYVSGSILTWSMFLHDWVDDNGDGLVHYANGTVAGELPRVTQASHASGGQYFFLNPSTPFEGTPVLRIYDYALYVGGAYGISNYTIELVRFDRTTPAWATVFDEGTSANVEIDVSALPYGYSQGVVDVDGVMVPLVAGKAATVKHVQDATLAPIDFGSVRTTYDYVQWSSTGDFGDGRMLPFVIEGGNASAGSVQVNVTDVGTNTAGEPFLGWNNHFTVAVGDSNIASSASAESYGGPMFRAVDIVGGADLYWLDLRCIDPGYIAGDGTTARITVEITLSFSLQGPGFTPQLNGMTFPSDGDTIGLVSDYTSATATLGWQATSSEFPDVVMSSSTLGFGVPPLDETYPYEYTTDMADQYVGPWDLLAGTSMSIMCTWEVGSGGDEMDYGLYMGPFGVHDGGYGDDELTDWAMATGGGSPESWSGTLAASGSYWVRIINFAANPNHGVVDVYALTPGDSNTDASDSVSYDTSSLADGTWTMTAEGTDSIGGFHQYVVSVSILNTPADVAPEIDVITDLAGLVLTGTKAISINVFDENNNDTVTAADDSLVWMHIYYVGDESHLSRIPVATWINVTDESIADGIYVFNWDTTQVQDFYRAKLMIVLNDGTAETSWLSEVFEVNNAAGAAADHTASPVNSISQLIPLLVMIGALGMVLAIPIARNLIRRRS